MAATRITVPLDASGVEGFDAQQPVKVLLASRDAPIASQTVTFDKKACAEVVFDLPENTRGAQIVVGPADAGDDELLALQTLRVDLPRRRRLAAERLLLAPIRIASYYWRWWRHWCRRFTIHGRLTCADGSPVPGATVCAYDVDAWWWWWSRQQVGCATTDANGAFTITFRWCCGWHPRWWWRRRTWRVEPTLASRILGALRREPRFVKIPAPAATPDPAIFRALVGAHDDVPSRFAAFDGAGFDPSVLDALREKLVAQLPTIPSLDAFGPWPWHRWYPWLDCSPDIVFRATQHCGGEERVVVDETWLQARRNIATHADIALVANGDACCVARSDCDEGECLAFTEVCDWNVAQIGGNGDIAAPVGYLNPDKKADDGDRPFAGDVTLSGTVACLTGVDYYELEWQPDGGSIWQPVPPDALGTFYRRYWDATVAVGAAANVDVPFSPTVPFDGRHVYETLAHYEAGHPNWGGNQWLDTNYDVVGVWRTKGGIFDQGLYRLRVVGYDDVGGGLANPRPLTVCGHDGVVAHVRICVDNQATYDPPGAPDNPCGPGTVRTCTDEPLTDIAVVRIVREDGSLVALDACRDTKLASSDRFEIDFVAHDAAGHLERYALMVTFGENLARDLLTLPSAHLEPLDGLAVPKADAVGPGYGQVRQSGVPGPHWRGGGLRFTARASEAFTESCCHRLELHAYKRTIVNCDHSGLHANVSQRSFQVTV